MQKKTKIRKALGSFRDALDAGQQELITKVDSLKDEKLTAATQQLNELGMHRLTPQCTKEITEQTLAMTPIEAAGLWTVPGNQRMKRYHKKRYRARRRAQKKKGKASPRTRMRNAKKKPEKQ